MTTGNIISTMGVLIFTITLIWGAAWVVLRLELIPGQKKKSKRSNTNKMLIIENLVLDTKRRLVKIEDGELEHLILLGPTSETHIHSKKISLAPNHLTEAQESIKSPETSLELTETKDKALH